MSKKKILLWLVVILIVAVAIDVWHHGRATAPTQKVTVKNQQGTITTPASSGFNKQQYSLTDPTSIWVIVNKQHPLNPKDYTPTDLVVPNVPLRVPGNQTMQVRKVTAQAMETMFADAKAQGINLMLSSGYRSYDYQVSLYDSYVKSSGQQAADTYSARPGYSEHQTGLAADIEGVDRKCEIDQCWGDTPEGKWLAANAYKYGFIIRYPNGMTDVTGYEPEPWHVRYVGVDLATEMHKQGVATLEQFFNVSGGTTYKD